MAELKNNFHELEKRIQNLINSHQKLRVENDHLRQENVRLEKAAGSERERVKMMQQGFDELRDVTIVKTKTQITGLKTRVKDMISEIDRSVALIDTNNQK